jgi:hypothetical protein
VSLTAQEKAVHSALIDAWNLFVDLPIEQMDDPQEFRHHLHILQRMISCRAGRREINQERRVPE